MSKKGNISSFLKKEEVKEDEEGFLIGLFMAGLSGYSYADSMCACNEPPIGKGGEYVTKEYVDSKVAEINSKLDAIESRIAKLKAEIGNIGAAPAGLVEKISALESALSDLGKPVQQSVTLNL